MSTLAAAKEAIAKHVKQMEAFQHAATVLSLVESIENERSEAHARLERIQKEVREHDVILSNLKGEAAVIISNREQDRLEHTRRAADIVAKAEETAKAVEKAARERAADLEAMAKGRAEKMVADAVSSVRVSVEQAAKSNALAAIAVGNVEAARKELEALNAKIDTAKARIADLLKG